MGQANKDHDVDNSEKTLESLLKYAKKICGRPPKRALSEQWVIALHQLSIGVERTSVKLVYRANFRPPTLRGTPKLRAQNKRTYERELSSIPALSVPMNAANYQRTLIPLDNTYYVLEEWSLTRHRSTLIHRFSHPKYEVEQTLFELDSALLSSHKEELFTRGRAPSIPSSESLSEGHVRTLRLCGQRIAPEPIRPTSLLIWNTKDDTQP